MSPRYHYKLTISYDGTAYFGWQKTKTGPSIQESLQKAVKQITQEEILPEGASRTDRGVHAIGQIASFDLGKPWEARSLQRALNAALPLDIRVASVESAPFDFHPTLHAKEKEYRYGLCCSAVQDPIHRLYSWAFRYPLDILKMEEAAQDLVGLHDFSAFANRASDKMLVSAIINDASKEPISLKNHRHKESPSLTKNQACEARALLKQREIKIENPFCTLTKIEMLALPGNRLEIAMVGDRFLYKMARNIAGTLIYIGCGKLPKDRISKILASKDRKLAGVTAPAHGLALYRVTYLE